ncbi:hypothetical protein, partial [Spirosoma areae]
NNLPLGVGQISRIHWWFFVPTNLPAPYFYQNAIFRQSLRPVKYKTMNRFQLDLLVLARI